MPAPHAALRAAYTRPFTLSLAQVRHRLLHCSMPLPTGVRYYAPRHAGVLTPMRTHLRHDCSICALLFRFTCCRDTGLPYRPFPFRCVQP